jgi:Ca2+-binding EF-hand superfamily protein
MKKPATASTKQAKPQFTNARDKLTEQDLEDLRAAFDAFDEDRSGSIDASEVDKAME